jgi:hypothetical protein
VYIGVREVQPYEHERYRTNNLVPTSFSKGDNFFTTNYSITTTSASCPYYSEINKKWQTDGCNVSNVRQHKSYYRYLSIMKMATIQLLILMRLGRIVPAHLYRAWLSRVFHHKTMLLSAKCNGKVRVTARKQIIKKTYEHFNKNQ